MEDAGKKYWDRIKQLGFFSMVFPFVVLLGAAFLARAGLPALVEEYDKGVARITQYILFGMGIAIFFFCEGISNFFANRLFIPPERKDKKVEEENRSSYFAYVFIMLWILNMISVIGFVGFLMSGNMTWLTVFVILNLSLQMKYFPSPGRFDKLVESVKK